ncbi:MAG TPA: methylmalonyl Co-A mutase-associated GTPase MeaB [Bacteroides sp.]|nr:methylmalonyl Co-A mutase-associated GTPase MeaB [Bacteroides sp.]
MVQKKKEKKTMNVKKGVEPPGAIHPDALQKFKKHRKRILEAEDYIKGISSGDRTLLSQAITIIESSNPAHQELARDIIRGCLPYSGKSIRIGITGVPGVGKSSFIEALGTRITSAGKRLAVLAIDPSSERSGGSILGDKTRMEDLSSDPDAFIRPSPSSGTLGGVARKTRESVILCEACGFEVLFIETVGVGQSETAVHSMVDFFLLLMLAGAGDELQGIKRGIMEMADVIAITKSDGNNRQKAERAVREYKNALHLFPPSESGWTPDVLTCSALKGEGLDEIWDTIEKYLLFTRDNGFFDGNRSRQARYWMYEFINDSLRSDFYTQTGIKKQLQILEAEVLSGDKSSFHAAMEILEMYRRGNASI